MLTLLNVIEKIITLNGASEFHDNLKVFFFLIFDIWFELQLKKSKFGKLVAFSISLSYFNNYSNIYTENYMRKTV